MLPRTISRLFSMSAFCVFVLGTAGASQAAWWSTGTDVRAMCINGDGGQWSDGSHGGIAGWCMNPRPGRDMQTSGTSNNYIMHVRMDRALYGIPDKGVMCLGGTHSGPDGNYNYMCPYNIN
jgi:hypothetical protein